MQYKIICNSIIKNEVVIIRKNNSKMNLFGLNLPTFVVQFKKLFCIEYTTGYGSTGLLLRIQDVQTMASIINCKLPLVIGDTNDELLISLYICVFKYDCEYDCKYSKKLYRHVRHVVELFINDIVKKRKNLTSLVQECLLDAVHHRYHNKKYINNYKMDELCKQTVIQNDLDSLAIYRYNQSMIYYV